MMFLEGDIAAPPTITVFSCALTGATMVAVRARAPKATAESRAIRLDMERLPIGKWRADIRGRQSLQRQRESWGRGPCVDCVVVGSRYGKVLRPVSKIIFRVE